MPCRAGENCPHAGPPRKRERGECVAKKNRRPEGRRLKTKITGFEAAAAYWQTVTWKLSMMSPFGVEAAGFESDVMR